MEAAIELASRFGEREQLNTLAEQGERGAAMELAQRYNNPQFIRTLAEKGDRNAAFELAIDFRELQPLRKWAGQDVVAAGILAGDYGEMDPLRGLAEGGDTVAAMVLMRRFDDPGPLRALARQGDNQAVTALAEIETERAFHTYESITIENGPGTEALKWLCKAANAGHAKAWRNLGHAHRSWSENKLGIQENNRVAFMWYRLATVGGANIGNYVRLLAREMTTAEISAAEQMARDWKPGQCPAP